MISSQTPATFSSSSNLIPGHLSPGLACPVSCSRSVNRKLSSPLGKGRQDPARTRTSKDDFSVCWPVGEFVSFLKRKLVRYFNVLLLLFCLLSSSLSLVGNSGRLTWVRHSGCKSSATQSYQCVQYFCVAKQWYGCQCLQFLPCAPMLMHTGAL